MIVHDCRQDSPEWHRLRLGIPTASNFHRIFTPKTMKVSQQAVGYMHWLLGEWILGDPLESPETQWMQRGQALEDQAVRSYCFEQNCEVKRVGFITTDDGKAGCSPDRFVLGPRYEAGQAVLRHADGLLEIKCPSPQVHVGNMLRTKRESGYRRSTGRSCGKRSPQRMLPPRYESLLKNRKFTTTGGQCCEPRRRG